MGKVECGSVLGLKLWFNSNDHRPPHFHASKIGEYELRVYFLNCTDDHFSYDIKWKLKAPDGAMLKELHQLALKFRVELLKEWERKVCL